MIKLGLSLGEVRVIIASIIIVIIIIIIIIIISQDYYYNYGRDVACLQKS